MPESGYPASRNVPRRRRCCSRGLGARRLRSAVGSAAAVALRRLRRRRLRWRVGGGTGGGGGSQAARTRSSRPTTSACTAWMPTSRCSRSCRPTTSSMRRSCAPTRPARLRCSTTCASCCAIRPIADANGSINSRSVDKTNFWQYVARTYGANLAPGQGLKGLYMPAEATGPEQTSFAWKAADGALQGRRHPDHPGGRRGQPQPLSADAPHRDRQDERASRSRPSTSCCRCPRKRPARDCHATGGTAASPPASRGPATRNLEIQSRENILLLHDSRMGTNLMASKPVLCAGCHYCAALDLAGTGPARRRRSGGRRCPPRCTPITATRC